MPGRARRPAILLLFVALAAGVGMWLTQRGEPQHPPAEAQAPAASAASPLAAAARPGPGQAPASGAAVSAADDEKLLWQQRLERARHTLEQYVKGTRYPPGSQPLREHPDQIHPLLPIERKLPLTHASRGTSSADVQIKLTQDRLHLVADDAVRLSVRCEDSLSAPVSCAVSSAQAVVAPHLAATSGARFAPAPVDFAEERDPQGRPGAHTAIFQPATQGFRGYSGPLRVGFAIKAGSETGELFFDLLYTGDPPARFTGKIREAVQEGSLRLYVGIEVAKPGRYVITGRLFDSREQPLGYLQINDPLPAGPQEVALEVFGKLIRDESPVWPLQLRDLDGYLLYEDRDPDREELPMLAGVVYRSQPHSLAEFSAAEWQSEERTSHIKEFEKDVAEAQSHLP